MSTSAKPALSGAESWARRSARRAARSIGNLSKIGSQSIQWAGTEECVAMTKILRGAALAMLIAGAASAQDKKNPLVGPIEYLWPKGAPLAAGEGDKDKPNLSVYLAPEDKATGAA